MKTYLKTFVILTTVALLTGGVLLTEIAAQTDGIIISTGVAPNCRPLNSGTLPVTLTENFDTLASTGTSSAVPSGFGFAETGTDADGLYAAGTGSSNIGNTYSFGSTGSGDRAFGGLQTGTLVPIIGGCFFNNTGAAINSVSIQYIGEQWRRGAAARTTPDRLDFQYQVTSAQLNLTQFATNAFLDRNQLDFSSPVVSGAAGNLDGNLAANRTTISNAFNVSIPNGQYFYIRLQDFDVAGADDGLAIDDFSITFNAATPAIVGINGRVLANGNGLSGAVITMTDTNGNVRYALSSPFGYYRFMDVAAGDTYVFTIRHKRFVFEPRSINVVEQLDDLNFNAAAKADAADNATTTKIP